MVQAVIQVAAFPNVPLLPGVPQLARSLLFPPSPAPSAGTEAASSALFHAPAATPVWGVFDAKGNQVIAPDSVRVFDTRQEYRISDYPVQQGGLSSYNKVLVPYDLSVTLVKGGSVSDRTTFLNSCDVVAASLDLFTIVTPEKSYLNANCVRVELSRRQEKGAFFVEVEMYFRQVVEVQAQYTTTGATSTPLADAAQPSDLPPVNQGSVQPAPASPEVTAAVQDALTATGGPDATAYAAQLTPAQVQTVPLANVASQTLGIVLNNQNCGMSFSLGLKGSVYMNLSTPGVSILTGQLVRNGVRMLDDRRYLGFTGELMMVDLQGGSDPKYTGLGTRFQLAYLKGL